MSLLRAGAGTNAAAAALLTRKKRGVRFQGILADPGNEKAGILGGNIIHIHHAPRAVDLLGLKGEVAVGSRAVSLDNLLAFHSVLLTFIDPGRACLPIPFIVSPFFNKVNGNSEDSDKLR